MTSKRRWSRGALAGAEAAWNSQPIPGLPTPQCTIEAIMYVVRQQGPSALRDDPDAKLRLHGCDAVARAQINQRFAKLFPGSIAA
jgi:hypothetical protein